LDVFGPAEGSARRAEGGLDGGRLVGAEGASGRCPHKQEPAEHDREGERQTAMTRRWHNGWFLIDVPAAFFTGERPLAGVP